MRNRRNTIRVNESTLKRIIKESVKMVLRESEFLDDMVYMDDIKSLDDNEYMDDGDLEPQYDKFPDAKWDYGTNMNPNIVDGLDPHSIRRSGQGNKKADNAASWDYFDAIHNGARQKMTSQAKTEQSRRLGRPTMIDKEMKQDWITSRRLPRIGGTYYGFPTAYDDFKKELDKRWENQIEAEKYEKMADTRPLHRKGSLNRELDEKIRREIGKIIR